MAVRRKDWQGAEAQACEALPLAEKVGRLEARSIWVRSSRGNRSACGRSTKH